MASPALLHPGTPGAPRQVALLCSGDNGGVCGRSHRPHHLTHLCQALPGDQPRWDLQRPLPAPARYHVPRLCPFRIGRPCDPARPVPRPHQPAVPGPGVPGGGSSLPLPHGRDDPSEHPAACHPHPGHLLLLPLCPPAHVGPYLQGTWFIQVGDILYGGRYLSVSEDAEHTESHEHAQATMATMEAMNGTVPMMSINRSSNAHNDIMFASALFAWHLMALMLLFLLEWVVVRRVYGCWRRCRSKTAKMVADVEGDGDQEGQELMEDVTFTRDADL